ncbi:transposase [uncultured Desulfuromusa sp.]|uniref:transposase n=1 Tax=uncultured Desulfuromusa sp. TaxID=219183 RepID=UPI003749FD3F
MARANRHHIPGQVWHITHRCHKREFLLKFSKDRSRWMHWLFEAKKRYKLQILNFVVTSNHTHLLVVDSDKDVIPNSLQLIAGRTAQEFNKRKKRKGAFGDDRYQKEFGVKVWGQICLWLLAVLLKQLKEVPFLISPLILQIKNFLHTREIKPAIAGKEPFDLCGDLFNPATLFTFDVEGQLGIME